MCAMLSSFYQLSTAACLVSLTKFWLGSTANKPFWGMADVIGVYCLVWVYTHKFTPNLKSVVALCLRYLKKADGFVQLVILS